MINSKTKIDFKKNLLYYESTVLCDYTEKILMKIFSGRYN